jgi:hypothetical protein
MFQKSLNHGSYQRKTINFFNGSKACKLRGKVKSILNNDYFHQNERHQNQENFSLILYISINFKIKFSYFRI